MERTAFYCGECLGFLRYSVEDWSEQTVWAENAITWITCDRCLARLERGGKAFADTGGPHVGSQPAVCLDCREPFEATRQAQKFCSASCRAKWWRGERQATAKAGV